MTNHFWSGNGSRLRSISFSLIASAFLAGCLGGGGTGSVSTDPAAARGGDGSASLVWTLPTTNADGSALVDLQGFNVYVGDSAGSLTRVASVAGNETNYTVAGLAPGTHYFAVSAYNADGAESDFSNVGSKTTY